MSIRVMTAVWEKSRAKGSGLLLLLAIADFAHDDGAGAWPSIPTLAKKTRLDDRTVQRLILRLEEAGELEIRERAGPNFVNLYRVRLENLRTPVQKRTQTDGDKLPPVDGDKLPGCGDKSPSDMVTPVSPQPLIAEEPLITINRQQQQTVSPPKAAAAASSFDLSIIKAFVRETKPHSTNPGGLARMLYQTGQDDTDIKQWLALRSAKAERYLQIANRWLAGEGADDSEIEAVLAFVSRNRNQAATEDEMIILSVADSMIEFRHNRWKAFIEECERSNHEPTSNSGS